MSPPTASISSAICRARAPLGALERHVLEQMRDAVLVRPLVAAAGPDPDAERGGLQMRHAVGDDRQAAMADG